MVLKNKQNKTWKPLTPASRLRYVLGGTHQLGSSRSQLAETAGLEMRILANEKAV
jgi:hypothetical protein